MNEKKKSNPIARFIGNYSFVMIFLVILAAYLIINGKATTFNGVMNILRHSAVVGILSFGMGMVIITGGIDLSVGSMLALVGGMGVVVFNGTSSILLTLLVCLGVGALLGFFNGILIGKVKMPPFIVTLATMLIYRSISQYYLRTLTLSIYSMDASNPAFDAIYKFGQTKVFGFIPMAGIVLLVVTVIMVFISTSTKFGKTVYAIFLASIGLNIFQTIIPADFIQAIALDTGKLMSTIMGGIMVGIGIGLTMSVGGSTGGTDIIALMVNKYRNVSPGRMILWMDVVVILSSLLIPSYTPSGEPVPFVDKITTVVYGFILIVVNSTVLDLVVSGSRQSVQLFILSKKYDEIADAITTDLHRGVTVLNGKGWYTREETGVLMVLTRKSDLNIMLRYIKAIDPQAFLSVSSVTGVYGKGFETIKTASHKEIKNAE